MQKQTVRLNRFYSASTEEITSDLSLVGNYYVYSQAALGQGVVTEFNVREFLENDKNESITRDFFVFLTANTTTSEFVEIYYSDKKLSSSFNDFYNSSVVSGRISNPSIVIDELIETSGVTYRNNNLLWQNNAFSPRKFLDNITLDVIGNNRINTPISSLTTYTNKQSYYIPIFINRNISQTPRDKFEICKDSNKIIGFIASSTTLNPVTFEPETSNLREGQEIQFSGFTSNLLTPSGQNPILQPPAFILTGVVHSTIQCFVDINLHIDSNEFWNNIKPPSSNQPIPITGLTDTGVSTLRYGFFNESNVQASPPIQSNPGNLINTRTPLTGSSRIV